MSESVTDSCLWPIEPGDCCKVPAGTDPAIVDQAIVRASYIMRSLSGGTVGQCTQTLRPLHMCASCRSHCCGGADGVALQGRNGEPVSSVLAVRLGATTVDSATYWYEDSMLWRVPPGRWPSKDPKWQKCGTGNAFCVDVLAGAVPDQWALGVAGELVCELVKACTGQKCRLPKNTTSISAQGVTVTLSEADLVAYLPEVAAWAKAVNPMGAVAPAAVWSPDTEGGSHHRDGFRGVSWLR